MEWERQEPIVINKLKNVYECKAGPLSDLVLAETRDHAEIKFKAQQATIMGSPIKANIEVKFLYTV